MLSSKFAKTAIFVVVLLLAACAPTEKPFTGVKIGKPYEINGKTYYPAPDTAYDKIGDASWYGPGFHGNRTASGEIFDQNDITAAHPTLPMPSLVRVTNIKNNKSVVVRINDRGPYHSNRIIDLSKKASELIDVRSVKPVRVQFLAEETAEYINSIKGISPRIDMVAYNELYNKKMSDSSAEQSPIVTNSSNFNNSNFDNSNFDNSNFNNSEIDSYAPVQSVASVDLENPPIADKKTTYSKQPVLQTKIMPKPAIEKTIKENKPVTKISKSPPSSEKYIILAGSFSSKINAQKLADSLDSIDNHKKLILIDNITVDSKEWWRVHIGPFTDRDKAEEVLGIVRGTGTPDARISRQK